MRVEKQVAVGLLVVLLVLAVVVGAKYFSAQQLSIVSADDLGSGGVQSASANWEVLALGYNYVVKTDGSLYWAEASDALKHWIDGNKTYVFDQVFTAMPSGGSVATVEVQVPAMAIPDNIFVVENYQGTQKFYSNQGKWLLPQLAVDPSTATWGSAERGRIWFNTVEGKIKFWDGLNLQVLPSVGGGSSSYKLAYTYTFYIVVSTIYAVDQDGNLDYSGSNSSTVINNALTVAPAGSTFFFQEGAYDEIYPSIEVTKHNVTLLGGWGAILKASSSLPAGYEGSVIDIHEANYVTVRDLQIDGNRLNRAAGDGHEAGIGGQSCNYTTIEHNYVHDCPSHGIGIGNAQHAKSSHDNKIMNNLVVQSEWNGISIGADDYASYRETISYNTIIDFCDVGISLTSGQYCEVSHNSISLDANLDSGEGAVNSYWAIGTEGSGAGCVGNLIESNIVDYRASPVAVSQLVSLGTGSTLSNRTICRNNRFYGSSAHQINNAYYIERINMTIEGDNIEGIVQVGGSGEGYAITLTSGADYCYISHVSIYNSYCGLRVQAGATNNVFHGVVFRLTGTNVTDSGTNTEFRDCYDFDTGTFIADT